MADEPGPEARKETVVDALMAAGCVAAILALEAAIRGSVTEMPTWLAAALPWTVCAGAFFVLVWVLGRRAARLAAAANGRGVRTPALSFHLRQSGLSATTRDKPRFGVTVEVTGVDTKTFVVERFQLRAAVRGGGIQWRGEVDGLDPATRIVAPGDGVAVPGRMTFSGSCEFDRDTAEKLWRGAAPDPEFPHVVIESGTVHTNVGRFTTEGLVGPMAVWSPNPPTLPTS